MTARALTGRIRDLVQQGQDLLAGGSLKGKILRNVGWMAIGFGSDLVVRLISSAILTRLLDPSAYGLISTVMVFMVFVTLLSDLGIKPIVTADDRGDEPGFLSILWTMQIMRGFVSAAVVCIDRHGLAICPGGALDRAEEQLRQPAAPPAHVSGQSGPGPHGLPRGLNEYRLLRHLEGGPEHPAGHRRRGCSPRSSRWCWPSSSGRCGRSPSAWC